MTNRVLTLLPWVLLAAVVAAFTARELSWRNRINRLDEIECLLRNVAQAPSAAGERTALSDLFRWSDEHDVTLSVAAYRCSTGQKVPMQDAVAVESPDTAFEIGFDVDGDLKPERTYHLGLKNPSNIGLLMME